MVGLEETESLVGRRVRQDGGDGVEVGIDAPQLKHAVIGRREGREAVGRTGVDDVRQGQRTGAARLDTTGTGGTGEVDRTGRDFARTGVGKGNRIAAARITELKPATRNVGTEGGSRGEVGTDGGDDQLLITQDGVTRVGVGVAQDERGPALLADVTRAGDDAGDGGVIQAGEAVVADVDVAPTGAGGGDGDGYVRIRPAAIRISGSRGVLTEVDLGRGAEAGDVGVRRDPRPGDELADGKRRGVTGRKGDGAVTADGGGHEPGRDGHVRTDFETTTDLDLGQGIAGVEREGGSLQEIRGAVGITPDQVLTRPVDDQLGTIGGESGETGQRARLPLIGARADGAVKGTGRLEEGTTGPVLRKAQVRSGRQRGPVDRDQRAALDHGRPGVSVGLVTQRPESAITGASNRQGAAVRIIDEAEVDLIVTIGITAEVQRTSAGTEVGDFAEIGKDEGGLVIRALHRRGAVSTIRLDRGIAGQGEETVDGNGRRLGRLEDIDDAAIVVGGRRRAGVEQGTTIKDEGARVGGGVSGVAATDGGGLADIGERADGQGADADDGGAGIIVEGGEGLRAGAFLDDGDDTSGLIDQAVEGAVTVAKTEFEDRRGGVGVDDRARASERTDEDARGGGGRTGPIDDRGAGGVQVEGRALTERDVGAGSEGRGRTGQLDGSLIDVGGTRVGVGAGDDEETVARLGERARATRNQRADGQRVSGRRAIGRHDDFLSRSKCL